MQRSHSLLRAGKSFLREPYSSLRAHTPRNRLHACVYLRYLSAAAQTAPQHVPEGEQDEPQAQLRAEPPSPSVARIARWMNLKDRDERRKYLADVCSNLPQNKPQSILLHYLHRLQSAPREVSECIDIQGRQVLQQKWYNTDDVARWAWILSAEGADAMFERFLKDTRNIPAFVFMQILRLEVLQVRTLRDILIYVGNEIVHASQSRTYRSGSRPGKASVADCFRDPFHTTESQSIVRELLYHARQIWPAALPSIVHMLEPLFKAFVTSDKDPRSHMHQNFSRWRNSLIHNLALPASIEPMKSMIHCWNAQKILLRIGEHFNPPLLIDRQTYQAIAQVLAASKKTNSESRDAELRSRNWPPWREAQDGMDALNLSEETPNRVLTTLSRMQESGYMLEAREKALKILGGQELDGTPTIHTRTLLEIGGPIANCEAPQWAARIISTRDVREAWSAFLEYREQNLPPALSVYYAMFLRLNYEQKRLDGTVIYSGGPGDGREVLPVPDDNMSKHYQSRLQPPSLEELYENMMKSGLRPQGQCLRFLISRARTVEQGLRYIHDSNLIDERSMACLAGNLHVPQRASILRTVPMSILTSWIILLCRFAPRVIDRKQRRDKQRRDWDEAGAWQLKIIEDHKAHRFIRPLIQAAELLKLTQITFRPAWYALFRALSGRGVVIYRRLAGDPKNDVLAWQVLKTSLRDFQHRGLELDPQGFQIICHGFSKAIKASRWVEDQEYSVLNDLPTLKREFNRLSETMEAPYNLSRLLHPIHGAHLHAYVRALGAAKDHDALLSLLIWMCDNHEELRFVAEQSRNGPRLLRRSIVAIKVHCKGTPQEADAQRMVDSIEWWKGWPGSDEVRRYLEHDLYGEEELGDEDDL